MRCSWQTIKSASSSSLCSKRNGTPFCKHKGRPVGFLAREVESSSSSSSTSQRRSLVAVIDRSLHRPRLPATSHGNWNRTGPDAIWARFSSVARHVSNHGSGGDDGENDSETSSSSSGPMKTTSPATAVKVLEERAHTLSMNERQRLLRLVLSMSPSVSISLLERVTRLDCWWNDTESMQALIPAWARLSTAEEKQRDEKITTGAVVAAQLLHEWGKRQQRLNQQRQGQGQQRQLDDNHIPHPPIAAFRTVLMALATEGNHQVAGRVMEQMLQAFVPDRDCFHRVLQACCTAGALESALQWLERMRDLSSSTNTTTTSRSLQPNRSTLKILLQTHVHHYEKYQTPGTGLAAYQLLQESSKTVEPDMVAINMTLNALAQEGNYEVAYDMLLEVLHHSTEDEYENDDEDNEETLDDRRISSLAAAARRDPIPLRTVLKACAQANTLPAAERAEEFLQTLHSLPCVDARSYTTVVAIWCKLGEPLRAKRLLEELTTLYLDTGSHHNRNDTIGKKVNTERKDDGNDDDDDVAVLVEPSYLQSTSLLNSRLRPDPTSFRTVIGAYSQKIGRMAGPNSIPTTIQEQVVPMAANAQQVLTDMYTTMGYTPNLLTCNTVLNCWSQARQPEAAEDFLQQMEHWNIAPDIVSYNTLIACHAKLGNLHECTTWMKRLISPQLSSSPSIPLPTPNTRTVTAVITALSKQGTIQAAEQAEGWFLQMQEWHADYGWDCRPNVVTLNALLTCWARAHNGSRAEYLLRQFQHYASSSPVADQDSEDYIEPPNTISYNTVLQAHGTKSIQKVENLLEELIAVGLQPSERTVQIAQRALEQTKDKSVNVAQKWKEWKQRFFYHVVSDKKNRKSNHKKRLLRDHRIKK